MTHYRIPPRLPEQLDDSAKQADALMRPMSNGSPYKVLDEHGALIGPYPACLVIPDSVKAIFDLTMATIKIPEPIPRSVREIMILVVATKYDTAYMSYAHRLVALEHGVPEAVLDKIMAGERPAIGKDWDDKCDLGYTIAEQLAHGKGVLNEELWNQSVKTFGQQGTVSLTMCVALYAYMAILMNACAVPLPEGL